MYCIEETEEVNIPHVKFYSLWAIVTFILIPPFWCLSVPAIVFSSEAKAMYREGNYSLAHRFSEKAKRFIITAWSIFFLLVISVLAVYYILHLSLI